MQKINKLLQKWFTLVEIMVVVTVLWIMWSFWMNLLNYEDVKEKVDVEWIKMQSFFEEIQFNAILWRWFKNHTTWDWHLPDTRKIEVLLEDSTWLGTNAPGVARVKWFYTKDWVESEYKTAISKNWYWKNPVILELKCIWLDWTESYLDMWKKLDIHFRWVYITDFKTDSNDKCLNSPRSVEFIVWRARSQFKYKFIVDRIPWTIYSKRGR